MTASSAPPPTAAAPILAYRMRAFQGDSFCTSACASGAWPAHNQFSLVLAHVL